MSGASDKARFYAEQSVPELLELERKHIFTKPEITSIAKKRSEFEHKLNARGSHPSDYVRYIEYEMNLESLRKKRVKRLGVKVAQHLGQRRIFGLFYRATKKFHGDVGLWMQYLGFARQQKSHKKVGEVLTRMLRMHPTKAELWLYAAKYAMEEKGDVDEARSFMQRGLRFCERSRMLWVEYGKLEMIFVAKIVGRRKVLGLHGVKEVFRKEDADSSDVHGDEIALPTVTADEFESSAVAGERDNVALEKLLSGAAPTAVFDAAVKQFGGDDAVALDFFDMVAGFDQLPCQHTVLNHILGTLRSTKPQTAAVSIRFVRLSTIGVDILSPEFPSALTNALSCIKPATETLERRDVRAEFYQQLVVWLVSVLSVENLDQDLRRVIEITLKKAWNHYQAEIGSIPGGKGLNISTFLDKSGADLFRQVADPGTQ